MLRIHEIVSATAAKSYYATADYYAEGRETVGRWGGKLAETLGLTGVVDREAFERMCDNRRPDGEPLTVRAKSDRRVGYDFTISVPKSASILRAFATPDVARELDDARDAAIAEMMKAIEADMKTRVRRGGADADRVTGNLAWAEFRHSTARPVAGRPPDMHEHVHIVCFNATWDQEEGRIKAGQFGDIKRDGEYYAAIFDSVLARRLEATGFRIDRRNGKDWEVAGVPQSLIDRFSKRAAEIEAEAARRGIVDPVRKAELGARTRAAKQPELTPERLLEAWTAQTTPAERAALAAVYSRETPPDAAPTVAQAAAFAIAHCSERESVIPKRELVRVALYRGLGAVSAAEVAAELPRQGVIVRSIDGRELATTEELRREEEVIVAFAREGRGKARPIGVPDGLDRGALDDDQWKTVRGLLNSDNRVNLVDSAAGTGKSTMLKTFDRGLRAAGGTATYLATTAAAVEVLRAEGFRAETVARFLLDDAAKRAATAGRIVVDETSMLGHKDARRLFDEARKLNAKLILLGDSRQHGSVPRGALMRLLRDHAGVKPFRLTAIKRQRHDGYRAAVAALSERKSREGFDMLDRLGWVRETRGEDRERAIADEYAVAVIDGKSCLVISPTHAEGERISRAIRERLRALGVVGPDDRGFVRLVPVDTTEASRGLAATYRPGDVLAFHQNAKGFVKGARLTVVDPAEVPLALAARFSVYRPEPIPLATGDAIRFTGTVKTRDGRALTNGAVRRVAGFTPGGDVRLDDGRIVPADAGFFRHAYVETSFGAQGRTVDRAILGMSSTSLPAINREQMYVSSSRARDRLTLHTDDKEAIRRAIDRDAAKLSALDLPLDRPRPRPKPSWRERLRDRWERLRRIRAADRRREPQELPTPERERREAHAR